MKLVLASSSPYRKAILQRLGLEFETYSPDIDETPKPNESADELVMRLAAKKAQAGAKRFPRALIIGSDQVADLSGRILGKPGNHQNAVAQLRLASGCETRLCTGIALHNADKNQTQIDIDHFYVHFQTISEEIIQRYVTTATPYDCCGALRAEGIGISLLEELRGTDPNTLIGLPVIKLCGMLERENFPLI
jgi:septum formation protein